MKKNNFTWWIVAAISLFFIGIGQSYYRYNYNNKIHGCVKAMTVGNVTETNYIYIKTSGLWVYYQFECDGKEYKNRCNIGLEYQDELKYKLLNKSIPILYCKNDPSVSDALITPEKFVEYGYKFPDSLRWISELKKK